MESIEGSSSGIVVMKGSPEKKSIFINIKKCYTEELARSCYNYSNKYTYISIYTVNVYIYTVDRHQLLADVIHVVILLLRPGLEQFL